MLYMAERTSLIWFIGWRYQNEFNTVTDLKNQIISLKKVNWELNRENTALHISSKKLEAEIAQFQPQVTK